VLPDPSDGPAVPGEPIVSRSVPLDVAAELRHPVVLIALRDHLMLRTAVPEAAIHEDRNPSLCEDDVRAHLHIAGPDKEVLSEAQPASVEVGTQTDLGLRVGPPISLPDLGRGVVPGHRVRHADPSAEGYGPAFHPCGGLCGSRCCHTPCVY
jgi:hypothetical protein